jgi:hypothetical protein
MGLHIRVAKDSMDRAILPTGVDLLMATFVPGLELSHHCSTGVQRSWKSAEADDTGAMSPPVAALQLRQATYWQSRFRVAVCGMRIPRSPFPLVLVLAAVIGGCLNFDTSLGLGSTCFMEGPCGAGGGNGTFIIPFIVGLDPNTVERGVTLPSGGHRAVLRVGDTVTLHLVLGSSAVSVSEARDTVRAVTWSATDSSAATLEEDGNGGLRLIAARVGRVGMIMANGGAMAMWACDQASTPVSCFYVTAIDVISR